MSAGAGGEPMDTAVDDAEHIAVWVSSGGQWNLNCACGWKSEGFGYYARGRALGQYDVHVEPADA